VFGGFVFCGAYVSASSVFLLDDKLRLLGRLGWVLYRKRRFVALLCRHFLRKHRLFLRLRIDPEHNQFRGIAVRPVPLALVANSQNFVDQLCVGLLLLANFNR
jgi:hypothetical protein